MRAGTLRHRITFQSRQPTDDFLTGFPADQWDDELTAFAAIEPLTAADKKSADRVETTVTHTVVVRYRSTLRDKMRFIHGDRVFHIDGIRNLDTRNRFLVIDAIDQGFVGVARIDPNYVADDDETVGGLTVPIEYPDDWTVPASVYVTLDGGVTTLGPYTVTYL